MDCIKENHVRRDNKFGITWCISCGKLFNKPVNKYISKTDRLNFNILTHAI